MTLGDALALVAGVAFAFFAAPRVDVPPRPEGGLYPFQVFQLLEGSCLALSFVALNRARLHRRLPSAVEWLGIVLGGRLLVDGPWLKYVDPCVEAMLRAWPSIENGAWPWMENGVDYDVLRGIAGGLGLAVILAGLAVLRLGRRRLPPWIKAIVLAGLAILALAVPLSAFEFLGANWIAPTAGFAPDVESRLTWQVAVMGVRIPGSILVGVPAVMTLADRHRYRRWTWAEWATSVIASIEYMTWSRSLGSDFILFTIPWMLDWAIDLGWIAIVASLSHLVAVKLVPRGRDWIEDPADRPQYA